MQNTRVKKYIKQIQKIYYGDNWLDEYVEKKLKPVNEENAFIAPDGYIHSVAEVVSHLIEWRIEIFERIQSGRQAKLKIDSENNWRYNEDLKKEGWEHLRTRLEKTQTDMVALLDSKDDAFLESMWSEEDDFEHLVIGWIEHDAYHLGQLGLIYKMITHKTVTDKADPFS